ncbi:MAG: transaldolase family protein, partial [Mucinivorans sp.]
LDQIRQGVELGVIDGVTTNPSLMAKEGVSGSQDIAQHYVTICEMVGPGADVSAEVLSTDFEQMMVEGRALAALHPNIVVKVP